MKPGDFPSSRMEQKCSTADTVQKMTAPQDQHTLTTLAADRSLSRPQSGCAVSPLIVASGCNAATIAAVATTRAITKARATTTTVTIATTRATVAIAVVAIDTVTAGCEDDT